MAGLFWKMHKMHLKDKKNQIEQEKEVAELKAFKQYTNDLEGAYDSLRIIKHDYLTIMSSFKLYLDEGNLEELKTYYYDELQAINQGLLIENTLVDSLGKMKISELKSVLLYKLSLAATNGLQVELEIREPIEKVGISTAILSQILGILLDNAMEAASETETKRLKIAVIKNGSALTFIVLNSWKKADISLSRIFDKGYSSKGEGRGLGLHTIENYTNRMKNLYLETEITDEYFKQILTVKES
jgi:two-component system sensor histidine kinase AgrC